MPTTLFKLRKVEPVCLHDDLQRKFWKIQLDISTNQTHISCGPVVDPDAVGNEFSRTKSHSNICINLHIHLSQLKLADALKYLEDHVNVKLDKGYHVVSEEPIATNQDRLTEIDGNSLLGKRSAASEIYLDDPMYNGFKKLQPNNVKTLGLPLESAKHHCSEIQANKENVLDDSDASDNDSSKYIKDVCAGKKSQLRGTFGGSRDFKGAYMIRFINGRSEFCKIQILRKFIRIEEGVIGDLNIVPKHYVRKDRNEAVAKARRKIVRKLNEGFIVDNDRFEHDFQTSDVKRITHKGSLIKSYKRSGRTEETELRTSPAKSVQEMEEEFQVKVEKITGDEALLGKPILPKFDTLSQPTVWKDKDPKGWYMTERLGGIKCLWTGFELWSARGMHYSPPNFFVEKLPKTPLEGFVCYKKGNMNTCQGIMRKSSLDAVEWTQLKFHVLDAPGLDETFSERLKKLEEVFEKDCGSNAELCDYVLCKGQDHLEEEFDKIKEANGEGLILKRSTALYTKGRSTDYCELKSNFEKEAQVVEHVYKDPDNRRVLKSLRVKGENGREFQIHRGLSEIIKFDPPALNSTIIYRSCGEISTGIPKTPNFVRVKKD